MNRHDCRKQLESGQQPTMFLREPPDEKYGKTTARNGRWYVLNTVVGHPEGIRWSRPIQGEEYIRIPLYSYTTNDKSLESLFSVGLHLMASVLSHVTVEVQNIEKAHIVVGTVYDGGSDKGYQVWIGIAFECSR
jgi:hypothetical protein